jgi:DNA-binding response OmpR family regulator
MALGKDPSPHRQASPSSAHSEFVTSVARRLDGLREALESLAEQPGQRARRDQLLRRLHAFASAARVLGFTEAADCLDEAERAVLRSGRDPVGSDGVSEVRRVLERIPSLVNAPEPAPELEPAGDEAAPRSERLWPALVVLYGSPVLEELVSKPETIDCLLCETVDEVFERARAQGPDVAVVDVRRPGAQELIEQLSLASDLGPLPIVAVGGSGRAEETAALVKLGAARVLPEPASAQALEQAILSLTQPEARAAGEPLGELTVEALSRRIAHEVERGLVQSISPDAQNLPIALGDGADVLGAVWGAVARVRQLVTLRSAGQIQFEPVGPEGAIPVAGVAERSAGERGRRDPVGAPSALLRGRRIVVVDDDPAVVWFMAGLLRTVDAEVLEAHDGERALSLVYDSWPDLVISDVLMPKLDGFSLCREIKRDVAVRDVPVILLSWKEDLLQRVRELGADADGYLRKEAAVSLVLERVREVLRPRARVEARLRAGSEVSGRLDGLTPRLVIQLAALLQKNARITVRDAAYVYEMQIRDGRPRSTIRTAADGSFERGPRVLAALLGVSAGRFTVTPDENPCRGELDGSVEEVLAAPIAHARAALRAVAAERLFQVNRVEIDAAAIEGYLSSTPEPAAGLIRELMAGTSPKELLLGPDVSARLLEAVLSDVARHGAVRAVDPPELMAPPAPAPAPQPRGENVPPPAPDTAMGVESDLSGPLFTFQLSPEPPRVVAPERPVVSEALSPSEVWQSEAETGPSAPRISSEWFGAQERGTLPGVGAPMPSASPEQPRAGVDLGEAIVGFGGDDSAEPPPVREVARPKMGRPPAAASSRRDSGPTIEVTEEPAEPTEDRNAELDVMSAWPEQQDYDGADDLPEDLDSLRPKGRSRFSSIGVPALAALAAAALAFLVVSLVRPAPDPVASASPTPPEPTAAEAPTPGKVSAEYHPLPKDVELPVGMALLEVRTAPGTKIYVEGDFVGAGPVRQMHIRPGQHEVQTRGNSGETSHRVDVRPAVLTVLPLARLEE